MSANFGENGYSIKTLNIEENELIRKKADQNLQTRNLRTEICELKFAEISEPKICGPEICQI